MLNTHQFTAKESKMWATLHICIPLSIISFFFSFLFSSTKTSFHCSNVFFFFCPSVLFVESKPPRDNAIDSNVSKKAQCGIASVHGENPQNRFLAPHRKKMFLKRIIREYSNTTLSIFTLTRFKEAFFFLQPANFIHTTAVLWWHFSS